jgi:predicted DsbA family dithiol-disulfide isomerase
MFRMKVEIWSDVMCPFCYIGKRNFEEALNKFSEKSSVETVWRSFQLDPTLPKNGSSETTYSYLAEKKGFSEEQARQMTDSVAQRAAESGLKLHFEKAVVANTFDAHRLSHFAQRQGLGNEIEEQLFSAHFSGGENIADNDVLVKLGQSIGLNGEEISEMLQSTEFSNEVNADIREASVLGVRGVPFFVFNRKYAVSGAQPSEVFLQTLEKSFAEWRAANPLPVFVQVSEGPSCTPESGCN